ncbi:hypothetical protein ACFL6S_11705 [Candidatus Poribacteria bacterium]
MFNRFSSISVAIAAFAVLSFASLTWAVDIECPIIADTLLAGHSSENDTNSGARESLRVKGYQGIVVFRFDMSPAQGFTIEGGTFSVYCRGVGGGGAVGTTNSDGISTIAHDWIEGTGDYTVDADSATFLWPGAALGDTWGDQNNDGLARYGEIDVLDVINGFGGSVANSQGAWDFTVDQRTDVELDAAVVQALVDGQYGIAVLRDNTSVNLDLASREWQDGANAATLIVHAADASAVDPGGKLASTWGILKSVR